MLWKRDPAIMRPRPSNMVTARRRARWSGSRRSRLIRPRFGSYFNCLGRGVGLYGDASHDITLIREFFGDLPIVGFFGNGELAPVGGKNYAHSYTGVLAIIGEA